eukprot:Gb_18723 [translate_table: standard]
MLSPPQKVFVAVSYHYFKTNVIGLLLPKPHFINPECSSHKSNSLPMSFCYIGCLLEMGNDSPMSVVAPPTALRLILLGIDIAIKKECWACFNLPDQEEDILQLKLQLLLVNNECFPVSMPYPCDLSEFTTCFATGPSSSLLSSLSLSTFLSPPSSASIMLCT